MSNKACKTQSVNVKSADADSGEFEALVAVFNNVDSYGDVILKGAFSDTLKDWEKSGDSIPVIWSHDKDDPFSHIGHVEEARETESGLMVRAVLDLENPKAAQVHRLLKARRVREFSFAFSYAPEDVNPAKRDGVEVRELKRLKLYEVGPTLVGANPATQLLSVKSDPESIPDSGPTDEPADDDSPTIESLSARIDEIAAEVRRIADIVDSDDDSDDSDETNSDDDSEKADDSQNIDTESPRSAKASNSPASRSAEIRMEVAALYAALMD